MCQNHKTYRRQHLRFVNVSNIRRVVPTLLTLTNVQQLNMILVSNNRARHLSRTNSLDVTTHVLVVRERSSRTATAKDFNVPIR